MSKSKLKKIRLQVDPELKKYIKLSAKYVKMSVSQFVMLCLKMHFVKIEDKTEVPEEFLTFSHKELRAIHRLKNRKHKWLNTLKI